jgi:NAD(P)-dependent dehydrogenase (short-subunit alcohol dehydrogenase family)
VHQLAAMGADLVLVGRSADKLARVVSELRGIDKCGRVDTVVADMADLASVRSASHHIAELAPTIHALVHNAGALTKERVLTDQGIESTIACHVLGPHLMTTLLLPVLHSSHSRVVTVSSGGMYAATLTDISRGQSPQMPESSYDGTKQYAIAKRLQVTLNEMWAQREHDITFAAMHPGWADTPGVQSSLPAFRLLTKPLLRTAAQGADTMSWLVADDHVTTQSGKFWCDRAVRDIHRLPRTKKSDTETARMVLWSWCDEHISAYLP